MFEKDTSIYRALRLGITQLANNSANEIEAVIVMDKTIDVLVVAKSFTNAAENAL